MNKLLTITALLFSVLGTAQVIFPIGGSPTFGNTDAQQLSLSGNTLTLQNGGTVNLAPYLDNTDGQTITNLSLSGNILSITLSGGNTATVDLSGIAGSGGTEITDGDKGDITVSSSGATWTVDVAAINSSKIQDNSITTADISNETIGPTDMNGGLSASTGDIPVFGANVLEWTWLNSSTLVTDAELVTAISAKDEADEITITDSGGNFTATDVEGALAELAGASGTDSGQGFVTVDYTVGELLNYDNTDITESGSENGRQVINHHYELDTINPSSITDVNHFLKDRTWSDSLVFLRDTDVYFYTFRGAEKTNDFLKIGKNQWAATRKLSDSSGIKRFEINVENYVMADSLGFVNPNPEEYTNSNALALLNNTNATTGLDAFSGVTQASVANTSPASVTHVWQITSTAVDNNSRGREVLTVSDSSEIYEYSFWARSIGGDESTTAYRFASGTTDSSYISGVITNTWVKISGTFEATGPNPIIQFHTNYLGGGSIGHQIEVTGYSQKIQ